MNQSFLKNRLKQYVYLMRLHKPIGILLLLWPTLWALWLAGLGKPHVMIVIIFIAGVIVMRSAGCVMNDIADQKIDGHVERTKERPLVVSEITTKEAWGLFVILCAIAFVLVLQLNLKTILLSFIGMIIVILYPLMKRWTYLPQLGLGVAFAWSVPMAFVALTGTFPRQGWVIFVASVIWPVIYDTMYAMVDRSDDVLIGVKSTAILFGQYDKHILGLLQSMFFIVLFWLGMLFHLHWPYFMSLILVAFVLGYHQFLIRNRLREACFKAFLHNQWIGLIVFVGIVMSYAI